MPTTLYFHLEHTRGAELGIEIVSKNRAGFGHQFFGKFREFEVFCCNVLDALEAEPDSDRGVNCFITAKEVTGDVFKQVIEASLRAVGEQCEWYAGLPEDDMVDTGTWQLAYPNLVPK